MNAAFIPVRGGSKSIPLKNIRLICGKPLVFWTIKAACDCEHIDKVYVATESDIIRETIESIKDDSEIGSFSKIQVIGRSTESASDVASTEYAMLEFAEQYDFDNIVLIQATSPLLQSKDLDRGFEAFNEVGTDCVLSVVRQRRFQWKREKDGFAYSINYDIFHRPRRQEFDGYLVENGAFYISSKKDLLRSQNRISGKIKAVEMDEDTFFEIDEPEDWEIIENIMKKRGSAALGKTPEVNMFLTDCDGCLTDGGMYYSEKGDELKKFNTRDGVGFALLRKAGILTGIITGEDVEINKRRAEKLKVDILETGCVNKSDAVRRICQEREIDLKSVAYIGDDINDLDVIKMVGFGCAPSDAMPEVKEVAKYVTKAKGGEGVVREVAEKIIKKDFQIT